MRDPKFRKLIRGGTNQHTFRTSSVIAYAILGYIFVVTFAYVSIRYTGDDLFSVFIVAVTTIFTIYILLQRPRIFFNSEGIAIANPFSSIFVPWRSVENISTKYSLVIETTEGKFTCWVAIAPGRYQHRSVSSGEIPKSAGNLQQIKASDSPRSDSGAASFTAREFLREFQSNPHERGSFYSNRHLISRSLYVACIALSFWLILFHA
jgi:hypothetical protein